MSKSGITIKLDGFEELLKDIEASGRTVESAVTSCIKQSAQTVRTELKTQMKSANVDRGLIDRMPQPKVEWEGNRCKAEVGYEKGAYDLKNPSDGYKVVFLNYGTPHRKKYGHIVARGFIAKAKEKSKRKLKKEQQETLNKILERLKR